MTQDEIISKLIEDTSIEGNTTALALSKLQCMQDSRTSSKIVGLAGSAVMATVFGSIVFIDVITVVAKLWYRHKYLYTK